MMYTDGNDFINDIKNNWNHRVKSVKVWGIIASILMIIVGVLCMIFPLQTTYGLEVFASIVLLCFGIWGCVRYAKMPAVLRTGVGLASSIMNILLGILLITSPAPALMETFGFMLGLDLLMIGFEQTTATGRLHMFGIMDTGWMTLDGVLNIICGFLLLFSPFASVFAVSAIFAFYLLVGGITLLVGCINMKQIE